MREVGTDSSDAPSEANEAITTPAQLAALPSAPAFWLAAQAFWPNLPLAESTFWALVAAIVNTHRLTAGPALLASLNARDLYLTAAMLNGQALALAEFKKVFLEPNRATLVRMGLNSAAVADTFQIVQERLLLAPEGAPARVVELVGKGDFFALLKVITVRTALNFKRSERRMALGGEDDEISEQLASTHALTPSPQNELLRAEARTALRRAIAAALASLEPRDKTLLRLHLFHKLSIDALGRMYSVHRATAARWLSRVHETIAEATRTELARQLQTQTDHLQSMMELANSNLHASFHGVWAALAERSGENDGAVPQPATPLAK